jgi:hypothetical protein
MPDIDWDAEAVAMANHVCERMFNVHRGAIPWRQLGIAVLFGNDGYTEDDRSKREVSHLRGKMVDIESKVLGFGVNSEDGYSWAMLVLHPAWLEVATLKDYVGQAGVLCGYGNAAVQGSLGSKTLAEESPRPDHSAN